MGVREVVEWAEAVPCFNLNEAERALSVDREYLRVLLHRAVEKRRVSRIERGLYTVHEDPRIYATHVETPSYIGLWSGLRWYDVTEQLPNRVQVMVNRDRTDLDHVAFHRTGKMFGFRKKRYNGFEVFVAEEEKLLLDCLGRRSVPVDELYELVERIEANTLAAYCERLGNRAVTKRAGFLFEQVRGERLEELQALIDHNYTRLDLSRPADGRRNGDWKVVVNTDVE